MSGPNNDSRASLCVHICVFGVCVYLNGALAPDAGSAYCAYANAPRHLDGGHGNSVYRQYLSLSHPFPR